jgi:subtilisin family serine protease
MKNLVFAFALLCSSSLVAQISNINFKTKNNKHSSNAIQSFKTPLNASLSTASLISKIKQKKSINSIKEEFHLFNHQNQFYVSAFVHTGENFDKSKLFEHNVKINGNDETKIISALIPISEIENLLNVEGIDYVEIGEKAEPQLNEVLQQTWVNWVHEGFELNQSYTGNGVIIGIIDRGFDYTHPTFYNTDYSQYRISRIWNQIDIGTPPIGYDYGNEIIGSEEILNKLNDNIIINGEDYSELLGIDSHGTHVAGIAAGSGSTLSENFKGVAYNSELVLCTSVEPAKISNAIEYIFDYASSVGKPAVINMSLGSNMGPHDGTSSLDKKIDEYSGEGRIIVGSAGNTGDKKLHLDYNFSENETIQSFINFSSNSTPSSKGSNKIDIWGEAGDDFSVALNIYDIDSDQYEDYTRYISASENAIFNYTLYDYDGDEVTVDIVAEHSNHNNSKPHIRITFNNDDQDSDLGDIYDFIMLEIVGSNTKIDAWLEKQYFSSFSDLGSTVSSVVDGNTNSTIMEIGGTANSIISVGSFTSKNQFTNFFGDLLTIDTEIGEIADSSGIGPTIDGRIKPDISAPGEYVVSSVNSFYSGTYDTSDTSVLVDEIIGENYNWYFSAFSGTSMASPVVAGIIALMLEADPTLTPTEIKQFISENAWTDNYTSNVPNNIWGYGKIDAHETLKSLESILSFKDSTQHSFIIYPNPTSSIINIEHDFTTAKVYDFSGRELFKSKSKTIDLSELPSNIYLLRLFDNSNKVLGISKIIKE